MGSVILSLQNDTKSSPH